MKMQKTIAVIIILASSVLTALVSSDIAYPAILCMLGLVGLRRSFTWNIKPERCIIKSLLLLFLAMLFAIHYRYIGLTGRIAYEQTAAFAWQTIARYFLASMILVLFLGSPKRLPSSLGLFHIAITISAGQVLLLNDMYIAYRLLELLSVILVVVYIMSARDSTATPMPAQMGRMSRGLAFGLILIFTANCGWIAGSILYRHVEVLNYLPVWFWRENVADDGRIEERTRIGFSDSGKLSSFFMIKAEQDPTPVLSITSDSNPAYLRARAFDMYRQSQWFEAPYQELMFPEKNTPFGMYFVGGRNLFRLRGTDDSDYEQMTIRHEFGLADAVFAPLGASFIQIPFDYLRRDDNDIVYAPNFRNGLDYRIAYTRSTFKRAPRHIRRMLDVPKNLDPRIVQLAGTIFANCNTTSEKIDAVIRHFRTNYTYLLGLNTPSEGDKLTYFLLNASTGYCEYFASGAAILLRLADVPTRYVTGFLVTQKGPLEDTWIARNMDAHAWVEAWDQEQSQWKIVEATVGQNLESMSLDVQATSAVGSRNALFGRLLLVLYEYGLIGLIGWLFKSYGLRSGLILMAIFLGSAIVVKLSYRKRTKNYQSRKQLIALKNPAIISLHKMLARMDRKVRAAGLSRELSETIHAFSNRLRRREADDGLWTKISDWYLEYAHLRYRGQISSGNLEQLQQRARGLWDSL
ncbi:MAG: transglutaminase domain-containing protein [Sedimentisphaerales bacterium]|nr:transglutaminase domain-containing protein [Sedimentisphaerales bacterium]